MVAQWVKEKSKAIKGTDKAKREMSVLRSMKATKAHSERFSEYEFRTGRNPIDDFNEWMDCPHWTDWETRGIRAKFAPWVAERVQELRSGDDWKAGW